MDEKIQYCQGVSSFQVDLKIQCHLGKLFFLYGQTDSEVYPEGKSARIVNTTLSEKSQVEGPAPSDVKACQGLWESGQGGVGKEEAHRSMGWTNRSVTQSCPNPEATRKCLSR